MNIVSVVGARPQFIKAAPLSREIAKTDRNEEKIIHTGQHYDKCMSEICFEELNIPKPDFNLGIGSKNHGKQTGEMIIEIEKLYLDIAPDFVIVYGDTNSTLAAAIAASKHHIPILHIEAGLRSYKKKMPEEINRLLTDNVSTILSCPTQNAVKNLMEEGFENIYKNGELANKHINKINLDFDIDNPLVINTGDIMYDAILYNKELALNNSAILEELGIRNHHYILATIHRPQNTDCRENLKSIFEKMGNIDLEIVLPLHPRTEKKIKEYCLEEFVKGLENIRIIKPVGYLDMIKLIENSHKVITDSGGIQKEACILKTPCITLRDETEWKETVEHGYNVLAGYGGERLNYVIGYNFNNFSNLKIYGKGNSAKLICKLIS